jgi:hypothetical protein
MVVIEEVFVVAEVGAIRGVSRVDIKEEMIEVKEDL